MNMLMKRDKERERFNEGTQLELGHRLERRRRCGENIRNYAWIIDAPFGLRGNSNWHKVPNVETFFPLFSGRVFSRRFGFAGGGRRGGGEGEGGLAKEQRLVWFIARRRVGMCPIVLGSGNEILFLRARFGLTTSRFEYSSILVFGGTLSEFWKFGEVFVKFCES